MEKHTLDPMVSAEHLAGAVRFATVSNADNSLIDYTKFDAFHEYLKETYPLVHKHLTLEHTDQAGLLFHWKGTREIRSSSTSPYGTSGRCPGR